MTRRWLLLACAVACLTCAHAASDRTGPIEAPTWPLPPAQPLVRWLASFPDAAARMPARPSFWRRALDTLVGIDRRPDQEDDQPLLIRPFGLAASGGRVVVADPDGQQVLRIDWRSGDAETVECNGRTWKMPLAVAVAPSGDLWIADGGAAAVVQVAPDGKCRTLGASRLRRPSGVALAGQRLFVTDPPRHTVEVFDLTGRWITSFGGRGEGPDQMNFPTGVAAAPDGRLAVVDALNFRVSTFTPDGHVVASVGGPGDGGGKFGRPKAVAVDAQGRLYVSDVAHDVVVRFTQDGGFDLAVGGSGRGPGQLTLPAGIAIEGNLMFVADSLGRRVEVYELLGGSV